MLAQTYVDLHDISDAPYAQLKSNVSAQTTIMQLAGSPFDAGLSFWYKRERGATGETVTYIGLDEKSVSKVQCTMRGFRIENGGVRVTSW